MVGVLCCDGVLWYWRSVPLCWHIQVDDMHEWHIHARWVHTCLVGDMHVWCMCGRWVHICLAGDMHVWSICARLVHVCVVGRMHVWCSAYVISVG